jgi:hypothetical protein
MGAKQTSPIRVSTSENDPHCRHARRSGTDDLITITITVGGIITIIITAHTAITITTIAGIITTTIITIATTTIDDVAFTESCCRRARCS